MKVPDLKLHPLALLGLSILMGLLVLWGLLREIKRAESLLLTEWGRLRYLAYLLETEAPARRTPLSAETLKEELVARGFKLETVRGVSSGVEVETELTWRDLARLLSWLSSRDLRVKTFYAEDPSGEGNFRIKMVIE